VPYQAIARENGLADASRIEIGQRLRIPGAERPVPVDLVTPRDADTSPPAMQERDEKAPGFTWPLGNGSSVTSSFGERDGGFHDGIDIAAPAGTEIRAAADGEVVYSAELTGYGNTIIVRHGGGYATVYAHNDRNHVREGDLVRQGQVIGSVGRTGRTTGPNLHFEVRKNNVARNPTYYLDR
jgi:murein DD-endopeptidase MepM/ murein hydrolase activator NlpD